MHFFCDQRVSHSKWKFKYIYDSVIDIIDVVNWKRCFYVDNPTKISYWGNFYNIIGYGINIGFECWHKVRYMVLIP